MVIVFFSFEAIQIAYTDTIDQNQHIIVSEKNQGVFEVIKEGVKLKKFLNKLTQIKKQQMIQQSKKSLIQSPVLVCLTAKGKKVSQPILQLISRAFEIHVIYLRVDKNQFKDLPFNRSILIDNEVCYGQGISQLRQKQELRLAIYSIFRQQISNSECIFIERNANQIKQLKKERFPHVLSYFQEEQFFKMYQSAAESSKKSQIMQEQQYHDFLFASKYLRNLVQNHKESTIKQIIPYDLKKLSVSGFLDQFFRDTTYYNISPRSWAPHQGSKQISAYVFHNISNMQLCLARASKLRQFSNEQQFQIKTLAYYFSFIINPSCYALSQDKFSSLMKFCKIKSYQNKRALFNIRPYIEGLSTLDQLNLTQKDILDLFINGQYRQKEVKGIAGLLITSLLFNDCLNIKTLCEQTAFVGVQLMDNQIVFLNEISLKQHKNDIHICRVDYYNPLNLSSYKELGQFIHLSNREKQLKIRLRDISPNILIGMKNILFEMSDQKLQMIRSLIIYYRWNTNLINFYDVIIHRMSLLNEALKQFPIISPKKNAFILNQYPKLALLLFKENYNYFILPSKNIYSQISYSYDTNNNFPKQTQNPFFLYVKKACSFAIYHISFPSFIFLQWIKSTNKYQIIEYISMINHTFEDYVIMDKRLKLQTTNDKKNAILIVDHVQLCEALINRPKSIKTVMIFRLRKINQIDDIGMISTDMQKIDNFSQSEDELINVLARESARQFGQQNKFYHYDWIFKNYIKVKCDLYNLNYNTALDFSLIFHKAICTNRNRLKEIKQNHPNLYVYLYTLPIAKDNQKVVYNYRMFEYLHIYQLFDKILNKKWNCRLETYQNSSVTYWKSLIGAQLAIRLVKSLREYLNQIEKQQNQSFQSNQCYNDCLQLIRTIVQPPNQQASQQLPYSLYYQVFTDYVNLQNFSLLQDVQYNDKLIAVRDQHSITVTSCQSNDSLTLQSDENSTILSFSLQNSHIFIVKDINQIIQLSSIIIFMEQKGFSYKIEQIFHLPLIIKEISINSIHNHFKIVNSIMYLVIQTISKLKVLIITINHAQEQFFIKEYNFDQKILNVSIHNENNVVYVLCVTKQHIYTLSMNNCIQSQPQCIKTLLSKLGDKGRIQFMEKNQLGVNIIVFQNNIIQIISILSGKIATNRRIQVSKCIKSLTISQNILYTFHEGEDSLYLYRLNEQSCERLHRYYWVQSNSINMHLNGNNLYIFGQGYMKTVRLRNIQNFIDANSS